jgi:hypothetical protein
MEMPRPVCRRSKHNNVTIGTRFWPLRHRRGANVPRAPLGHSLRQYLPLYPRTGTPHKTRSHMTYQRECPLLSVVQGNIASL